MLLNQRTLRGVADGSVTCTYRRWTVVRVRPGSTMRTRIGVVEVTSVALIEPSDVTDDDAQAAGFASAERALAWIAARGEGDLYRVGLRLAGEDPRVALRADDVLTADDVASLDARLARMDRAAPEPWTHRYLDMIAAQPGVVARELAASIGLERDYFKVRVRRLKELGLTESLAVGYRLSPRGRAYRGRCSGADPASRGPR